MKYPGVSFSQAGRRHAGIPVNLQLEQAVQLHGSPACSCMKPSKRTSFRWGPPGKAFLKLVSLRCVWTFCLVAVGSDGNSCLP